MIRLFAILLFLTGISLNVFGEPVNQYDSLGKKHGKWMLWLDPLWKNIDSASATYARYTYFDHGHDLYPTGSFLKNMKLINETGTGTKIGNCELLNGIYKWMNKDGTIFSSNLFAKGLYLSCVEYFPNGKIRQQIEFKRIHTGTKHSYLIKVFSKQGTVKYYCFRKPGKHWIALEVNEEHVNKYHP